MSSWINIDYYCRCCCSGMIVRECIRIGMRMTTKKFTERLICIERLVSAFNRSWRRMSIILIIAIFAFGAKDGYVRKRRQPHSIHILGFGRLCIHGISSTHVVASTARSDRSVVRAFGRTQIGKQSIHSKKLCKRIKPHKLHRVHYHFNLCCEQSRLFCFLIRPPPPPPLPVCTQLLLLSSSLFRN